ncbi:MAG: hypothetical protein ACKVWV_12610 [Planctomycetota bacterium]
MNASNAVARTASNAVDPSSVALDDEEFGRYLATKYEGWAEERMSEAIEQLQQICRGIEATPELFKTQQQEYVTLNREIAWLKEHRQR